MPAVTKVTPPHDTDLASLVGGYRWASGALTFSFPVAVSSYESPYGSGEPSDNFGALSAGQQNAARSAFAQFASVASVTFTELTGSSASSATIRIAASDEPSTAHAYMPSAWPTGGDVWLNKSGGRYISPVEGNYAYTTLLHEIGHALGLEHPHNNGLRSERDSSEYTVMTYRSYEGAPLTGYTNEVWGYAQTLMMYDISAMQYLYGANFSHNQGNTIYSWSPTSGEMFINGVAQGQPGGNRIFETVWDGGGNDTYDFSNYSSSLSVDLRPGYWTSVSTVQLARLHYSGSQIADGNIANSLLYAGDSRSLIENAVGGSGDELITGNEGNNALSGGSGSDTLEGGSGSDVLDGGDGDDTAVYSGARIGYRITALADGSYRVADQTAGRDGTDVLWSIELLQFLDGLAALKASGYSAVTMAYAGFSPGAGGWANMNTYPRSFADVNGDGLQDIVGFGYAATYVALGTGAGHGTFGATQSAIAAYGFGPEGGSWVSDSRYPRELGDINGDGRADVVGFGDAGVYVSLGQADGSFAAVQYAVAGFGAGASGGHWLNEDLYPRELGDVNGDGSADIVGFGAAGVYVALSNGDGSFAHGQLVLAAFGSGASGGSWFSDDRYPRRLADIDGDGDDDLIGFGDAGVYVARSNGDGSFAAPALALSAFGAGDAGGGWASQTVFPRQLADINGDGADDFIGFGGAGAYAALADGQGGFAAPELILAGFGAEPGAGSWVNDNQYPRFVTDLNGDGLADIAGIGDAGIYVSMAQADDTLIA